jgi:hypothetical protein
MLKVLSINIIKVLKTILDDLNLKKECRLGKHS